MSLSKLNEKIQLAKSVVDYSAEVTEIKNRLKAIKTAVTAIKAKMEKDSDNYEEDEVAEMDSLLDKIDKLLIAP